MPRRAKVRVTKKTYQKSGGTYYQVRWIDPDTGKETSKNFPTERKAENHRRDIQAQLDDGTYSAIQPITFAKYKDEFIELLSGEKHKNTAQEVLDRFAKHYKGKITGIRYVTVEKYLKSLESSCGPATIKKHFGYLRNAFNTAIKRGYLGKSPMHGMKAPKIPEQEIRILSDDEEKKIMKDARGSRLWLRWYTYLMLLFVTAARREEPINLEWRHIDLTKGNERITFEHTKSGRIRYVPIEHYPELLEKLREIKKKFKDQPGPWSDWNPQQCSRRCGRLSDDIEVDFSLHDIRRTRISRWIKAGIALPTVQRLAGHSDIKTTLKYYHRIEDSDLREAMRIAAKKKKKSRTRKK